MRLRIVHRTVSRFDVPALGLIQSQRLIPQDRPGQRVLSWEVHCTPEPAFGPDIAEGTGDRRRTAVFAGPLNEVEIVAKGEVETEDRAGVLGEGARAIPREAWLVPTPLTEADEAIRDLSGALGRRDLDGTHALMNAVSNAVRFEAGRTDPATTAADAVAAGAGVCQDHAHVMIAAAQAAGVPARYAVGYLEAGTGAGVSHAWAELWIDGLGWTGFDAANGCSPDSRYVRLCCGRDAAGAAPIRGAVRGRGTETLEASVQVVAAQQQ